MKAERGTVFTGASEATNGQGKSSGKVTLPNGTFEEEAGYWKERWDKDGGTSMNIGRAGEGGRGGGTKTAGGLIAAEMKKWKAKGKELPVETTT